MAEISIQKLWEIYCKRLRKEKQSNIYRERERVVCKTSPKSKNENNDYKRRYRNEAAEVRQYNKGSKYNSDNSRDSTTAYDKPKREPERRKNERANSDISPLITRNYKSYERKSYEHHPNFSELIKMYMMRKFMSVSFLAEKAGVDDKTISRLRNEPYYTATIEIIVAVCLGLELKFEESREMVYTAGFVFRDKGKTKYYKFLLEECSGKYTVDECNDFLVSNGLKPLTRPKKDKTK